MKKDVAIYIIKRLLSALAVMALVSLLAFLALDIIPGNSATVALGVEGDASYLAELEASMGLERPFYVRLFDYYSSLFRLDLGTSSYFGQKVGSLILQRLGVTFSLAFFSVLLAFIFSLILGAVSAIRKGGVVDTFSRTFVQLASAMPSFWLSLLLLIVFSAFLGWVRSGSYVSPFVDFSGYVEAIILPVIVLAISESGPLTRLVRASMLESLDTDWYANCQVKGLSRKRATGYALRSALNVPVSQLGLQLAKLLGGTAIVESVYALPGLGRLFLTAVEMRDLQLVQGIVLFVAFAVVVMNLVTDLVLFALNPQAAGGVIK